MVAHAFTLKGAAGKPETSVTATATRSETQRLLHVSHPLVAKSVLKYSTENRSNGVDVLAWFGSGWEASDALKLGDMFRKAKTGSDNESRVAAYAIACWWQTFLDEPRKSWTAWHARDVASPWLVAVSQLVLLALKAKLGAQVRIAGEVRVLPSSLEVFCARCGDRYESKPPRFAQTCGCPPSKTRSQYRPHISGKTGAFPLPGVYKNRWVWPAIECRHPGCERRFDAYQWNEWYCPDHRDAQSRVAAMRRRRGNSAT